MKKIIIPLIVGIFLIGLVSAEINNYAPIKAGECITVKQICASCSYVNVSISYENSSLAIINQGMTNQGGGIWTYNFCDTSQLGRYDVMGSGDLDGNPTGFGVLYFDVTTTGKILTSGKTTIYTIILIFSVLIFGGLAWFGFSIPSKNDTDEMTGYIFAVNNLKYLKQVFLGLAYITLVWISYFVWMISYSFLDFDFLTKIFRINFVFLTVLTLPLFILYTYITIANLVKDQKIKDMLLRGLRIR